MKSLDVKQQLEELMQHHHWSDLKAAEALDLDRRTIGKVLRGEKKTVYKTTAKKIAAEHSRTFSSTVSIPAPLWQAALALRAPADVIDFALTAGLRPQDERDEAFWQDLISAISVYPNLFESAR